MKVPVLLHTHYTSGVGSMTCIKAIEAGVDVVDCAISPMAMGTSQPPTESLVATLKGTPYDTGYDLELLTEIAEYFSRLRAKYLESGQLNTKVMGVDVNALIYQVPGGMLSNLVSQLKQAGKEDLFMDVLKEIPQVRKDLGYPPLYTHQPDRWNPGCFKRHIGRAVQDGAQGNRALVRGEYGRTPAPIPEEIMKKIIGDEEPITCRPADLIPNELDRIRAETAEYMEQEEDLLTYAMYPQVALKYFEYRRAQKYRIDPDMVSYEYKIHPLG